MAVAAEAESRKALVDESVGMTYLDRLPRRLVVLYLPLAVFTFVLLFPFYWMTVTALKPNHEMTDFNNYSPFWPSSPTFPTPTRYWPGSSSTATGTGQPRSARRDARSRLRRTTPACC